MNRSYLDITSCLGEPRWWDDQAVPRYQSFAPDLCGIYDEAVSLLEIRCQRCGRSFTVASAWDPTTELLWGGRARIEPTSTDGGWLHYGDPPNHGCVGDTMNAIILRVLQYWERGTAEGSGPAQTISDVASWRRRPELEFDYGGVGV